MRLLRSYVCAITYTFDRGNRLVVNNYEIAKSDSWYIHSRGVFDGVFVIHAAGRFINYAHCRKSYLEHALGFATPLCIAHFEYPSITMFCNTCGIVIETNENNKKISIKKLKLQ